MDSQGIYCMSDIFQTFQGLFSTSHLNQATTDLILLEYLSSYAELPKIRMRRQNHKRLVHNFYFPKLAPLITGLGE